MLERSLESLQECGQAVLAWENTAHPCWLLAVESQGQRPTLCRLLTLGLKVHATSPSQVLKFQSCRPSLVQSTSRDPPFLLLLPSHTLPHNTCLELLLAKVAVVLTVSQHS